MTQGKSNITHLQAGRQASRTSSHSGPNQQHGVMKVKLLLSALSHSLWKRGKKFREQGPGRTQPRLTSCADTCLDAGRVTQQPSHMHAAGCPSRPRGRIQKDSAFRALLGGMGFLLVYWVGM